MSYSPDDEVACLQFEIISYFFECIRYKDPVSWSDYSEVLTIISNPSPELMAKFDTGFLSIVLERFHFLPVEVHQIYELALFERTHLVHQ